MQPDFAKRYAFDSAADAGRYKSFIPSPTPLMYYNVLHSATKVRHYGSYQYSPH